MARSRTKRFMIGVLPAVATTVAVTAGAGTASADITTVTHTYRDASNVLQECTIDLTRTVPFADDPQVGQGGTAVVGSSRLACDHGVIAYVSASFKDPDGLVTTTAENSDGGRMTYRRYAPIGDAASFRTVHRVDFSGSDVGCIDNCEFSAVRTK